ncbi:MAG TPA: NHL repeat-containing protein [Acidobacteriota bacterium]|nr:NHL repeat-containing protein [Acidobacteriota bacterium]
MNVSSPSPPVARRVFLEKSLKGATALALSGLISFTPSKGMGADRYPGFLNLPLPQYPAWTADGKLLVTFIAEDGSYGLFERQSEGKNSDSLLSVGASIGKFNWPQGIAVDKSIAYIVDSNNGRIQRLDLDEQRFLEPFGGLGKKSGLLLRPQGICVHENEIFIADTRNHRIQVFSIDGVVKRTFGELGDANDQFRLPTSCAVSPQGDVFVVDSKHAFIKVFGIEGRYRRKFGGIASFRKEPGLFSMPTGIALDAKREMIYVADTGNSRIQVFDYSGRFLRLVDASGMTLKTPQGIALLDFEIMAISDPDSNRVWITVV